HVQPERLPEGEREHVQPERLPEGEREHVQPKRLPEGEREHVQPKRLPEGEREHVQPERLPKGEREHVLTQSGDQIAFTRWRTLERTSANSARSRRGVKSGQRSSHSKSASCTSEAAWMATMASSRCPQPASISA